MTPYSLDAIVTNNIRIPSPNAVAIKILETIRKDEKSFADLADVITSDPALTARILKAANSPYYGFAEQIDSCRQAIRIIGTQALTNIALSFVIYDTIRFPSQGSFDIDHFWRRAITAGTAAELLAQQAGKPAEDIFVSALLQDFGVLVLFLVAGADYTGVFDAKRINGNDLHEEEIASFGFTHADVGHRLLSTWQLPASICQRVGAHHAASEEERDETTTILHLSDKIASIYHGNKANRRLHEVHTLLKHYFDLDHDASTAFIDTIGNKAKEAIDLFDIEAGNMIPFSQIIQEANKELSRLNYSYEQLVLELTQAKRHAEQLATELKNANDNLRDLALRDGLTGLYNHRYFQEALTRTIEEALRYDQPLSLLFLDIDFFKQFNDTYGHPIGDQVLQELAGLLVKLARKCDIVARYGGEEFTIILPQTGTTGARVLANRLRRGVEQHVIRTADNSLSITISVGVSSTEMFDSPCKPASLIVSSDEALYQAKRQGRNQVHMAAPATAPRPHVSHSPAC